MGLYRLEREKAKKRKVVKNSQKEVIFVERGNRKKRIEKNREVARYENREARQAVRADLWSRRTRITAIIMVPE